MIATPNIGISTAPSSAFLVLLACFLAAQLIDQSIADNASSASNCTRSCQNESVCVLEWQSIEGQNHAMEQVQACRCAAGYTGPYCEVEIARDDHDPADQCTLDCQNGGTCVFEWMPFASGRSNYFNSYFLSSLMICDCTDGFTGMTCDIEYEQCDNGTPCLGGGSCLADGTACDCANAHDQDMCEGVIQYCNYNKRDDDHDQHVFCLNGGTCDTVQVEDGQNEHHQCECPEGFTGNHCEDAVSVNDRAEDGEADEEDCTLECQNEGTCKLEWETIAGAMDQFEQVMSCKCTEGYEGQLCEEENQEATDEEDECTKSCFNQGECVWQWNSSSARGSHEFAREMICECPEGFTGEHCDQTTGQECAMECHNGGECVYRWESMPQHTDAMIQSIGCECAFGFTGPSCELLVDQGSEDTSCSLECQNSGECVFAWMNSPRDNYFNYVFQSSMMICECPTGRMGMHCEYQAQSCDDGTLCFNGGKCIGDADDTGSYTCDCSDVPDKEGTMCMEHSPVMCDNNVVGMDESLFCLNRGKCDSVTVDGTPNSHHGCSCPDGYFGSHCEFSLVGSNSNADASLVDTADAAMAKSAYATKSALILVLVVGVAAVGVLMGASYTQRPKQRATEPSEIVGNLEADGTIVVKEKANLEEATAPVIITAHYTDIL